MARMLLPILLVTLTITSNVSAQWVPEERQEYERLVWDQSQATFPEGLKFYELTPVSQMLFGFVGERQERFPIYRGDYKGAANVNFTGPWSSPSGLRNSPTNQWRKVAGAYFPGKIKVWIDSEVPVKNSSGFYQKQQQIKWQFPDGTVFVEMLVRVDRKLGQEWAFEIRQYEIKGGKFHDGTTYRPTLQRGEEFEITVQPERLADFGFAASKVLVSIAKDNVLTPFKATRGVITADDDHSFVPRGFAGNVRNCRDCHAQAGKPMGYGATNLRGGSENFSWNPFTMDVVGGYEDPVLDSRWGLDVNGARLKAR